MKNMKKILSVFMTTVVLLCWFGDGVSAKATSSGPVIIRTITNRGMLLEKCKIELTYKGIPEQAMFFEVDGIGIEADLGTVIKFTEMKTLTGDKVPDFSVVYNGQESIDIDLRSYDKNQVAKLVKFNLRDGYYGDIRSCIVEYDCWGQHMIETKTTNDFTLNVDIGSYVRVYNIVNTYGKQFKDDLKGYIEGDDGIEFNGPRSENYVSRHTGGARFLQAPVKIGPEPLSCDVKDINLNLGEKFKLPMKNGEGERRFEVQFNQPYVSVDSNGVVTGLEEGSGGILVKDETGSVLITYTVKWNPKKIVLPKKIVIKKGNVKKISCKFYPKPPYGRSPNIKYKSSNKRVSCSSCVITGKKRGKAIITARTDAGLKAKTTVIVK